jgi:hypothetical protein
MLSRRIYDHVRRNVWGIAAMFVALTGTAVALPGKNTVDSGDIKNNQVRSKDVKNDNLSGADIAEQSLGVVPSAASAANAQAAANAEALDGVDSSGFLRWGQPIPSGVTVRGVFRVSDKNDGSMHSGAEGSEAISFPAPAPANLTVNQVNFADGSLAAFDDDPECTGTVEDPTAPPGKVCLYEAAVQGVSNNAQAGVLGVAGASRLGFHITGVASPTATFVSVSGTWAYTAP